MISPQVAPLAKGHDLGSFRSGDGGLDDWLHKSAMPMGGEGLNRTHLWVDEESGQILGYFALTPTVITTNALLDKTAPALLLAKMALSEDLRGQDPPWGPRLLLAAFGVVLQASDLVGGRFLAVDTRHERAFEFYRRSGFEPVENSRSQLLMKISTIRKLLA